MPIALKQDVLRLQVPVHEAHQVQVLQSDEHLRRVEARVRFLEPLLGLRVEQRIELAAVAQPHDKMEVRVGLQDAVDSRHKRVVDDPQDVRLGQAALHLVALIHLALVERLHRELQVCALQLHQVHLADVAGAQLAHLAEVLQLQPAMLLLHLHQGLIRRVAKLVWLLVRHVTQERGPWVCPRVAAHAHALQRGIHDFGCVVAAALLVLGGHARGLFCVRCRNVHLHADEKADLAVLVQHGRQREHVPELLARLCVVEDPDGDLLPILDRLADLLHRALVRVRALEKTAVAPQHLLARVPRQLQERVRRKHDRRVWQAGVGDDKVLLDALDG
mmetsp:Transcript_9347/g.28516  ORF Transcript_9347/g.28516 Transcript_9347/m.28516 type:complete len:332 (+) Transcript_9347:1544-2539(+)